MMISQETHSAERRKAEWNEARFSERKSLENLGHRIIQLAGHLNAANYRFLMLIAEWDRLHVDAETLRDSVPGRCSFEHGPSVSAETSRRLSCDCSIVPIIENGDGEPLNVGRKTRSIPPALHRALNSRDKGCCCFPGCPNTRYLDGHHIKHWAHGGETKLSNLLSLCRFHHRQVHEGNVVVRVLDDGAVRFLTQDGRSFDSTAPDRTRPLSDWHQLVKDHEEQGLSIDRHTAATRWDGGACDYSIAVDSLLRRWRQH